MFEDGGCGLCDEKRVKYRKPSWRNSSKSNE